MNNNYCMNCMQKADKTFCVYCGAELGSVVNEVSQLAVGTLLLDKYLVGKVLGQGGFGITYIGLDTILERRVAIKEYFPKSLAARITEHSMNLTVNSSQEVKNYEQGKSKFLDEAKTMSLFSSHKCIPEIYDFFELNNSAYIVMEYLSGETLLQYIQQHAPISFANCVQILNPIINILKKLHESNRIHRDISPDNMIFNKDKQLCLLDFGASREFATTQPKTMSIMVKQGYTSPEQYTGIKSQGTFSDMYSIGSVLYQMLTGRKPQNSLQRIQEDNLIEPIKLNPKLTREQNKIIIDLLKINPKERIQTVKEYNQRLLRLSSNQRTSVRSNFFGPAPVPKPTFVPKTMFNSTSPPKPISANLQKTTSASFSPVPMTKGKFISKNLKIEGNKGNKRVNYQKPVSQPMPKMPAMPPQLKRQAFPVTSPVQTKRIKFILLISLIVIVFVVILFLIIKAIS